MIRAACEFEAKGIYVEKPFARSLEECDRIKEACLKSGTKLAVAHRNRYHPALTTAKKLIGEGLVGQVVALRGRGKEDHRGGGEDLWVLGTHVFDLFDALAGKPLSCSAEIRKEGKLVEKAGRCGRQRGTRPPSRRRSTCDLANGKRMVGHLRQHQRAWHAGGGIRSSGYWKRGDIGRAMRQGTSFLLPERDRHGTHGQKRANWIALTSGGLGKTETQDIKTTVHNHLAAIRDLVVCAQRKKDPKCGLAEGISTVSFVSSVFESHRLKGERVDFPLKTRVTRCRFFRL